MKPSQSQNVQLNSFQEVKKEVLFNHETYKKASKISPLLEEAFRRIQVLENKQIIQEFKLQQTRGELIKLRMKLKTEERSSKLQRKKTQVVQNKFNKSERDLIIAQNKLYSIERKYVNNLENVQKQIESLHNQLQQATLLKKKLSDLTVETRLDFADQLGIQKVTLAKEEKDETTILVAANVKVSANKNAKEEIATNFHYYTEFRIERLVGNAFIGIELNDDTEISVDSKGRFKRRVYDKQKKIWPVNHISQIPFTFDQGDKIVVNLYPWGGFCIQNVNKNKYHSVNLIEQYGKEILGKAFSFKAGVYKKGDSIAILK